MPVEFLNISKIVPKKKFRSQINGNLLTTVQSMKWGPFISVKSKIIMINDHHLCRFIDLKINNKIMCMK